MELWEGSTYLREPETLLGPIRVSSAWKTGETGPA